MKPAVKDFQEFYGLDKLIEQERALDLQPDDLTVAIVAKKAQWSRAKTERIVREWVEAGKLEYVGKKREPEKGQRVDVWRLK